MQVGAASAISGAIQESLKAETPPAPDCASVHCLAGFFSTASVVPLEFETIRRPIEYHLSRSGAPSQEPLLGAMIVDFRSRF